MRVVAVNGSPDPQGNTAFLLRRVLDKAEAAGVETHLLQVGTLMAETRVAPFCNVCSNPCQGSCYSGSPLEGTYETLRSADALVLGSPVYFGTVSAQLKAFFDKTRKIRAEKGLYNTVGAAVTVAASKYGGQETTMRALHDMMLIHGMIIVGDGHLSVDCGHHGVCAQRPASEDEIAHRRADILALRLIDVCQATMALRT